MASLLTTVESIQARTGAYILALSLDHAVEVALKGESPIRLSRGLYLYCGSAYGPGGLKARIGRHMRRGKTIRWHIDRLTEQGHVRGAWTFDGGNECALVAALSHLPAPIAGFGSSDCPHCRSHLLAWPGSWRSLQQRAASLGVRG